MSQGPPVSMSTAGSTNLNHHAWSPFLYVLSVCVIVGLHAMTYIWRSEDKFWNWLSPSTVFWGPNLVIRFDIKLLYSEPSCQFFYFSDLSLCINAVSVQVMCRGQRGCKTLWSWSYKVAISCLTMVLGTELGPLNCWTIPLVPVLFSQGPVAQASLRMTLNSWSTSSVLGS